MSLARIKAKESKGKQKLLPKLKAILANPYKNKCPVLSNEELDELRSILVNTISTSGLEARVFATVNHIRLGLESSLRAINNRQCGCVFISLSIKPSHIVSLIARNSEIKDETVPVYAQPQLEEFTREIFGIRALALVLPDESKIVSKGLLQWVSARRRPKKLIKPEFGTKNIEKKRLELKSCDGKAKNTISGPEILTNLKGPLPSDRTSNVTENEDFISFDSFGGNIQLDKQELEEDKTQLLGALYKMSTKIQSEKSNVNDDVEMGTEVQVDSINEISDEVTSNSDDFLSEYQSLSVHKISPNPNKSPKKKKTKQRRNKCK